MGKSKGMMGDQSVSDQYVDFGNNIVHNVIRNGKNSLPSCNGGNVLSSVEGMNISLTPPTDQGNPRSHDIIQEKTESLNEGQLIDSSNIMSEEEQQIPNKQRRNNLSDFQSQKIDIQNKSQVSGKQRESQRSANLNKRPDYTKIFEKNHRALSKASERKSNNFSSIQMYNQKERKHSRKKSLPEIQRHKINNKIALKSYESSNRTNIHKLNYISSNTENKNFRNIKKQEIGQSFVSFNANNSVKNNKQVPLNYPFIRQSFGVQLNQIQKVRESFESQTTEHK